MPTINNYTFSDVTYVIEENADIATAVGASFATLTISPASGFTIDANDFSIDPSFSNTYVSSVTFAQSGVNVICTINFVPGVTMPSANVSIPLCVVGQGVMARVTIQGTVTAVVGSNINGDGNETNTNYSNDGVFGETELLFSRTYNADTGYYFGSTPSCNVTEGNQSNYNIVQTPTYNSDNQLTNITFDVNYVYPSSNVSGDRINIRVPSAKEIYVSTEEITRWYIRNLIIPDKGMYETLYVYGEEGATYSVTLSDGTTTQTIASNVTMGGSGRDEYIIAFDANTSSSNITWTFTISGDISSSLPTTIVLTQGSEIGGRFLPKTSSVFEGGYSVTNNGGYLLRPVYGTSLSEVSIQWLITAIDNAPLIIKDNPVNQIQWENQEGIDGTITSASAGTATLSSTVGLEAGMRFNGDGNGFPLNYEIVSVDSPTQITYTPTNLTITDDTVVTFTNSNGFNIDQSDLVAQFANDERTAVTISGNIRINTFGDEDTDFYLDLDEVLDKVPIVLCDQTQQSGGLGITDYSIQLSPEGGLLTFLLDPQGVQDKFEIIHGNSDGIKVATSSMTATNTAGPFDNAFGTYPSNIVPTTEQAGATDQFIGTNSGTIPTKETEFNIATGYNITSMTVGAFTYKQVIWWEYDSADYNTSPIATFRVTGPSGTAWRYIRECCPNSNCTQTPFVPSAFGMTVSNTSPSNACSDTTYSNTVYVSEDRFALGKTVYTDSSLTTAFVGDSGNYGINQTPSISIKINSNGEIIDYVHLCTP